MRIHTAVLAAVLVLSLGTVRAADFEPLSEQKPAPWTGKSVPTATDDFRFAIMADRTGGLRPGVFKDAVGKVNLLRPDFVTSVGDYITGYSEDKAEIDREWDEFDGIVRSLDMPFFYIPGNHDVSNDVQLGRWRDRLGPTYYHFLYKNALFLCLNTQDGAGTAGRIGAEQADYFRDVLARNPDVRWTFVFMHQPLWRGGGAQMSGWEPIEDALHGRSCTVFAGHLHAYTQTVRDGHDYILLATTGGGSDLSGPFYGHFDHVMWVTMTGDGPRYANLMLSGVAAKDVTTPASLAQAADLAKKVTIVAQPLIVGSTLSGKLATTVRLKNDSDLVQSFEGVAAPHPTLPLTPSAIRLSLQPGEERTVQVAVTAAHPLPLEETARPRIDWTVRMAPKGCGEVSRTFSTEVPMDTVYPCRRAARPVTVDGDLTDWPDLPLHVDTRDRVTYPENWSGPEDGSFAFATAYDDQFLCVTVRTTDDKLMVDRADVPWSQDSVAVSLDARAAQVRATEPPQLSGQFNTHLLYYLSPSEKAKMIWYAKDHLPEGSRAVCVPASQGMALEVAVPLSYLDGLQGGSWSTFQLNVLFNDVDMNGVSRLSWRPDWYRRGAYLGAGAFRRE